MSSSFFYIWSKLFICIDFMIHYLTLPLQWVQTILLLACICIRCIDQDISCFQLVKAGHSWSSGQQVCQRLVNGGHLATIQVFSRGGIQTSKFDYLGTYPVNCSEEYYRITPLVECWFLSWKPDIQTGDICNLLDVWQMAAGYLPSDGYLTDIHHLSDIWISKLSLIANF